MQKIKSLLYIKILAAIWLDLQSHKQEKHYFKIHTVDLTVSGYMFIIAIC